MDDRTRTDFRKTLPLDLPAPSSKAVPKKRRRFVPLLLLIATAGVGYWLYTRPAPQPAPPPGRASIAALTPVVVAAAAAGDIDVSLNALGTVTSLATVTIRSQISGYLTKVAYEEGQLVKKGDLLAEIDSRTYELALAQAKRYQELAKTNAIPRQQLDTQASLVAQYQANIISDQAQIDNAKLNIAYCHIVAPVSGRVGLRLIDQGNYVTAGDATGLVVITQLQPISVIFTTAEDNLPQIQKRLRAGATLPVTAYDRTGTVKLGVGALKTIDNQIDTSTGTVKLRAEFANADDALFPNQFVNVWLLVDTQHDATIIPTSAVQRGAPGTYVYLVNADSTVAVRPVTLGVASGERVAVSAGLSPGDRVVVDGADKLRNGAKVTVRQSAPAGAAAPISPAPGSAPAAGAPASAAPASAAPPSAATAPEGTPPAAAPGGEPRQRGSRRSRETP
jgi:multidrug efflux system membrane fusion protein